MTTEQRANIDAIAAGLRRGTQDAAAIAALANELDEYRLAVAEWAEECRWGAESWKREPYNAALFALAARNREK